MSGMLALVQSTAKNLMVLMVSSTGHVSGVPGLTLTITASKDGGAFASISPTVTDRGSGWYNIALTTSHTDTLGDLVLHITATGADESDVRLVVAVSPATATAVAAVQTDVDDIQTRLPAALVSGRMDSSVGAMAANVLTATAINADAITAAKVADGTIDAATFAAGAINAAAIAAAAITAAKFATDAIDSNALAASAVTEIQSGLATSASIVTAQADLDDIQTRLPAALVSGRMDSSVGAMAANVITNTAIATSGVTKIRSIVTGTASSGSTTTIVDAGRTEADTDYWKGCFVLITSGTASGEVRLITGFNAATDTLTFAPALTQAISTNTYEILASGGADVRLWNGTAPSNLISGRVDSNAQVVGTGAIVNTSFAASAIDATAIATDAITAAKIANGAIDAATFAAGAIDAAAIANGAIDAATFAAGAIDAASIATSAVTKLRSTVTGTASSGSTTTIVDAGRTEADTDYWKGSWVLITSGTSSGQVRLITAFNAGTDTLTFAPALTQAVTTNTYEILPAGAVDLRLWNGTAPNNLISGRVDANAQALAAGVIAAATFATDAIDSNALAASAVTEIQTGLATSAALVTAQADLDDIQTRLPAALVSGRIDASVGAMAAGVITATAVATGAIDADALASDAVTEIRSVASGTSDSGTTTTMVDSARTEADTDYWKGLWILFTSGNIAGQARLITGFNAGTDTITFTPATTQAVATQNYEILPAGAMDLRLWNGTAPNNLISGRVDANAQALAAALITAASFAADAIDANALATSGVNEIRDSILNATVAELAQAQPSATPSVVQALALLYMALRNNSQSTASERRILNDAGTVICKAPVADDGTTFTQGKLVTGP